MTLQALVEKFEITCMVFEDKKKKMSFWEEQFAELERATTTLSTKFQLKYEESELKAGLPEEVTLKLENRREGIRLSAKSASRLGRKLNPDKPLYERELHVITEQEIIGELSYGLESGSIPSLQFLVDRLEKAEEKKEIQIEEIIILEESKAEIKSEIETENDADEKLHFSDGLIPVVEVEQITEDIDTKDAEMNAERKIKSIQLSEVVENAINENNEVIEELNEIIEIAEKRFCTFIEKAVAPVMDGLYSGKKHGISLIKEIKVQSLEQTEYIEQWLNIYNEMLTPIEKLFESFEVELHIPAISDSFDENVHEPIAVVEDGAFNDEEIKEVVRYGLSYKKEIFNQNSFMIRPAQVIVVKNTQSKGELEEQELKGGGDSVGEV